MEDRDVEPVQLLLDVSRCHGCGICVLMCPERITVDACGFAQVDDDPITDADSVRRAAWAIWSCPRSALTLADIAVAAGSQ